MWTSNALSNYAASNGQSNWDFGSNTAAYASNALSNYAASNGVSNWNFGSNTSAWTSNALSNYADSNGQSNWNFGSNTSAWTSNALSNYADSNGQSNWNFGSNTAAWTSNVLSNYALSNAQSNWNFGSNTAAWLSNNPVLLTASSTSVYTLCNVGIGATSATSFGLQVSSNDIAVYNGSASAGEGGAIQFNVASSTQPMAKIGGLFSSATGTHSFGGLRFDVRPTGTFQGSNLAPSSTDFYSGMVIDEQGQVCIGNGYATGASVGQADLCLENDSTFKPATNTWNSTSDERLKEDIVLADLDLCYSNVRSIPLKYFAWRDDAFTTRQVSDRHKLGWIAQDVETVFPKAVSTTVFKGIDGCKLLNTDQLYATMYGAIQKLQLICDGQQSMIQGLVAKDKEQEAAIMNLQITCTNLMQALGSR